MEYKAHGYQEHATKWVEERPAAGLLLDMGLGKTVCTLTAAANLMYDSFEVSKVLVIAPLRVAEDTWPEEKDKWDHLRHLRLAMVLGNSPKKRLRGLSQDADIYIVNRENVKWMIEQYGEYKDKKRKTGFRLTKPWPFDLVVIDELSSFKSTKAARWKILKGIRKHIKRIVGLTGTPTPNGLLDLWPQIYLLDQGERLGRTMTEYQNRYFYSLSGKGFVVYKWGLKPGAEEKIYEKISDICMSMKAEDYLDMPERIDNYIKVKLKGEDLKRYKTLVKDSLLEYSDGDIEADTAAILSNKLLQMANGVVYDENGNVKWIHDEKVKALEELVEESNGKPVLVYYWYKSDRERLLKHFKARELKTTKDKNDWNAGKIPVMIAHPASTGHGLNLQAGGSTIIWFGLTWSLELYQQANARLYRQGQKETVVIHHLVTEGTIDEQVIKSLETKDMNQDRLLEAVKAQIKRAKEDGRIEKRH